MHEAIVRLLLR